MTILNLAFDGRQALFVSDELGAEEHPACIKAGRHVERCQCVVGCRSKVAVLPHVRTMLGFFGEAVLMDRMYLEFATRTAERWDIDDMLAELAVSLRHWHEHYRSQVSNVAMLAHCRADGRVEAWALEGPAFTVTPLAPGLYLRPDVENAPATMNWPHLEAAIAAAVSRQSVDTRVVTGGHLHFSRLTRDGFEVRWSAEALPRNLGGIP